LTLFWVFFLFVLTHFIVFTLQHCILCIFVVIISVLQKSTFCCYALKYSFFYFILCLYYTVIAATRIYPQAMTVILTDGYLKVIHLRCVLNIRIKPICAPSNTTWFLNDFKNHHTFQLK
jgi:hypothetical protein